MKLPTERRSRVHLHRGEAHRTGSASHLNGLRAGVLGANDGIVSVAGLVVGVAGATSDRAAIATAALAGVVAGAASMALGEYVSVSSQRDSEQVLLARERAELAADPDAELAELADLYEAKGLAPRTARQVAEELTARDAFAAHTEVELGFDPLDLVRPWQAAVTSAVSFIAGAALPVLAVLLPSVRWRVPLTFAVVLLALALTGAVSARIGGAPRRRAVLRVVVGGALAMAVTFSIGQLAGGFD
jgi:VIT1/CCC1 family predicted Fe2+/Mn2+ transporter